MRVNVVCKPSGEWILERMARELVERIPGVTVNAGRDIRHADQRADLNYYIPARDFGACPVDGKAAGFYTHGATGLDLIGRFEFCGAMNRTMAAQLKAEGATRVVLARPGVEGPERSVVFGVCGRVYNNGRKGEHLVKAAVRAGWNVIACGPDERVRAMRRKQWPCPTPYTVANRAAFYQAIDYLLVTSTLEGGPMPVPEAIVYGKPVIAPKGVGWCDEFPCIRYEAGNWESLKAVLEGLTKPPTWAEWADVHRKVFAAIAERAA